MSQIAAGAQSSYALTDDGSLYAWGWNDFGQLGTAGTRQALPTLVSTAPISAPIKKLTAGRYAAYALTTTGQVYAWGRDNLGQLGDGGSTTQNTPVAALRGDIPSGVPVDDIASSSSSDHVLVRAGGVIYAWGSNAYGQLGIGTTSAQSTPVRVSMPSAAAGLTVTAMSTGDIASYVAFSQGSVYAWGSNGGGQLGDGSTTSHDTPTLMAVGAVKGGETPTLISGGSGFVLMRTNSGHAFGVGRSDHGELGFAASSSARTWLAPDRVPASFAETFQAASGSTGSVVVSRAPHVIGLYGTVTFTASALPDGFVLDRTTGIITGTITSASSGTLVALSATGTLAPLTVDSNAATATGNVRLQLADGNFVSVAVGETHSLALDANGNVFAWGSNVMGELGDGSQTYRVSPVLVALPDGVRITKIAAGGASSYALADTGVLYAWGFNDGGQLGDGSTTRRSKPVTVQIPGGVQIADITAANGVAFALAKSGAIYSWGKNDQGLLGARGISQRSVPGLVDRGVIPASASLVQIAAGASSAYVRDSLGRLYSWGYNVYGQLGDGSTVSRSAPVAVGSGAMANGTTVTAVSVSSSGSHVLATGSDGATYAWGYNAYGQLGDGTASNRSTPVRVTAGAVPAGVGLALLGAGAHFSTAIGSDGLAYAWGRATAGALADGSTTDRLRPTRSLYGAIPGGIGLSAIAAGNGFSLMLAADGFIYSAGINSSGQLGVGSTSDSALRVMVNRVPSSLAPATQTVSEEAGVTVTSARPRAIGLYGDIRYSATGLPAGFEIDPLTGIIRGLLGPMRTASPSR